MLAGLNLGHFGAKLHASDDAGQTWHEVVAPAFPPQPEGQKGRVEAEPGLFAGALGRCDLGRYRARRPLREPRPGARPGP